VEAPPGVVSCMLESPWPYSKPDSVKKTFKRWIDFTWKRCSLMWYCDICIGSEAIMSRENKWKLGNLYS
jgi:hypothetical protein